MYNGRQRNEREIEKGREFREGKKEEEGKEVIRFGVRVPL